MADVWLIEFTTRRKETTYHLALLGDGLPLCGRRLRAMGMRTHKRDVAFAVFRVAQYNQPGGRNGINGCAQCYAKKGVLLDPVTRLGDLVREKA